MVTALEDNSALQFRRSIYQRRSILRLIQTVFDQIGRVAEAAKITANEPNQIDVTHRTTYRPTASIIIMFDMKRDRNNFY